MDPVVEGEGSFKNPSFCVAVGAYINSNRRLDMKGIWQILHLALSVEPRRTLGAIRY